MATPVPEVERHGLVGARRWFVVAVALGLIAFAGYLLLPQRISAEGQFMAPRESVGRAVALIDTRGGPLRIEGTRGSRFSEGNAVANFSLHGIARAGPSGPVAMRLVNPAGVVVWQHEVATGQRWWLTRTTLDRPGVWRLEIEAHDRGQVKLVGGARASRWVLARHGSLIPVGLLLAGLVAAVAVWFGRIGARVAGVVLLGAAAALPAIYRVRLDLLKEFPPGARTILAASVALAVTGALALSWTWLDPHRTPRRLDVVVACAGVPVLMLAFSRPTYELDEPAFLVAVLAGLLLIAAGSWGAGRRSASTGPGSTLRVDGFSLLACVCAAAAVSLLVAGVALAVLAGSGIGLNDNGPDPASALGILVVALTCAALLAWAAVASFRTARPDLPGPSADPPARVGDGGEPPRSAGQDGPSRPAAADA